MSDRFQEQPASPPSPPGDAGNRAARTPEEPVAVILVGLFVSAVLGGLLLLSGSASDLGLMVLLGYLLVVAGSVITSVGVIAAGVRLGMRWAEIDRNA